MPVSIKTGSEGDCPPIEFYFDGKDWFLKVAGTAPFEISITAAVRRMTVAHLKEPRVLRKVKEIYGLPLILSILTKEEITGFLMQVMAQQVASQGPTDQEVNLFYGDGS